MICEGYARGRGKGLKDQVLGLHMKIRGKGELF